MQNIYICLYIVRTLSVTVKKEMQSTRPRFEPKTSLFLVSNRCLTTVGTTVFVYVVFVVVSHSYLSCRTVEPV